MDVKAMLLNHMTTIQAFVFFVNFALPFSPVAINEEAPKFLELPERYPMVALVDVKGLLDGAIWLQYRQYSPRLSNLLQSSVTIVVIVVPEYPTQDKKEVWLS